MVDKDDERARIAMAVMYGITTYILSVLHCEDMQHQILQLKPLVLKSVWPLLIVMLRNPMWREVLTVRGLLMVSVLLQVVVS